MHHRARGITGLRVGYLTAIRYHGSDGKNSLWILKCDCGAEKLMAASKFKKLAKRGVTASCGCKRRETIGAKNKRHGMSKHPAFAVWPLWRSRHYNIQKLETGFYGLLGQHGVNLSVRSNAGAHRQQQWVFAPKLQMGNLSGTGTEYTEIAKGYDTLRPDEPRRAIAKNRNRAQHDILPVSKRRNAGAADRATKHYAEVYDLVNYGPLNRFVIAAPSGPLIVHNCENLTQAAARDVLASAMPVIEKYGYEIVLTVHDEVVCEAPDTDDYTYEALSTLLATPPHWADGLPLNAGGFEAPYYRKE